MHLGFMEAGATLVEVVLESMEEELGEVTEGMARRVMVNQLVPAAREAEARYWAASHALCNGQDHGGGVLIFSVG